VISLEYAFLLFLFTDLVNRLAGIADGKWQEREGSW
jgi:hypothetical protein